jgi:1,4-alpha-glucan branching enzyme
MCFTVLAIQLPFLVSAKFREGFARICLAAQNLGVEVGSGMNRIINKQNRTFSFNAPNAARVLLAGDFTHWLTDPIPLQKQPNGTWKTTILLGPGTYHYRFFVDDQWRDDPECNVRVRTPFGSVNDVIQVPGKGVTK